MSHFENALFDLICRTATTLPTDVVTALAQARAVEAAGSRSELALATILRNLQFAKEGGTPLCQDTGFPTFWVRLPEGVRERDIRAAIIDAIRRATDAGKLRPNAVDTLTGKNIGNVGDHFPAIYFEPSEDDAVHIDLLLKGGGSENVSDQIALPATFPDFGTAGRNLDGVKKAVLQTIKNAEGKGCAPGIIAVHIGGDRATGWAMAKRNLFRKIGETNPNAELAALETDLLTSANELGIGPMGFGGRTTLLDVRVSASHRLPASYFVTVAYLCWASRRGSIACDRDGRLIAPPEPDADIPPVELNLADVRRVTFPIDEETARSLRVGDVVLCSGRIVTGRDTLHAYTATNVLPVDLKGSAIYHCGPVAAKDETGAWRFLAAGPTTSIREETYQADVIAKTGIRAVIGKGGMGAKTSAALKTYGAVYLHAIGGAAAFYARSVTRVAGVHFLDEWGMPEAMWDIEIKDFLAVVTMDSHGDC